MKRLTPLMEKIEAWMKSFYEKIAHTALKK
jgi:hypothetical protein